MSESSTFVKAEAVLVGSTLILTGVSIGAVALVVSSMPVGTGYLVCAGLGLFGLFASLIFGCYGMVKSLAWIGCDQWNVRTVTTPFLLQTVLLCLGVLFLAISPFVLR